jgi:hypothetical protein
VRTWLRSVVNAMLGRVPGKTSRLDTATRMAMDADLTTPVSCLVRLHQRSFEGWSANAVLGRGNRGVSFSPPRL